jgi:hypothetical protein
MKNSKSRIEEISKHTKRPSKCKRSLDKCGNFVCLNPLRIGLIRGNVEPQIGDRADGAKDSHYANANYISEVDNI